MQKRHTSVGIRIIFTGYDGYNVSSDVTFLHYSNQYPLAMFTGTSVSHVTRELPIQMLERFPFNDSAMPADQYSRSLFLFDGTNCNGNDKDDNEAEDQLDETSCHGTIVLCFVLFASVVIRDNKHFSYLKIACVIWKLRENLVVRVTIVNPVNGKVPNKGCQVQSEQLDKSGETQSEETVDHVSLYLTPLAFSAPTGGNAPCKNMFGGVYTIWHEETECSGMTSLPR
ncbi:hypothetical protein T07_14674 [Trichinella nelsoni]|uniref:Uncharacterized protein n=1 Tax=Trichinella nelsoni TaxID=6336 RepID=A0A0V0SAJ2_9BILA|nr:hypothetical protein T07_14674 [Trichinella nelsoni]